MGLKENFVIKTKQLAEDVELTFSFSEIAQIGLCGTCTCSLPTNRVGFIH